MKITVTTPSVRKELLPMVERCLKRQTFTDYEWLVGSPTNLGFGTFVQEPSKREGDYYGLNKCWNELFRQAKGELIVNIVDGLWFPPDLLQRFWDHYEADPMACIGGVGDQYDQEVNGKPEHRVWSDPRKKGKNFYQIIYADLELCVASIPLKAIKDVGGIDEEFDKYAAISEKEMCARIGKLGYTFWIDEGIEYRAVKHPRLNEKWDEHYWQGVEYCKKCLEEIEKGQRCKIAFL